MDQTATVTETASNFATANTQGKATIQNDIGINPNELIVQSVEILP